MVLDSLLRDRGRRCTVYIQPNALAEGIGAFTFDLGTVLGIPYRVVEMAWLGHAAVGLGNLSRR